MEGCVGGEGKRVGSRYGRPVRGSVVVGLDLGHGGCRWGGRSGLEISILMLGGQYLGGEELAWGLGPSVARTLRYNLSFWPTE